MLVIGIKPRCSAQIAVFKSRSHACKPQPQLALQSKYPLHSTPRLLSDIHSAQLSIRPKLSRGTVPRQEVLLLLPRVIGRHATNIAHLLVLVVIAFLALESVVLLEVDELLDIDLEAVVLEVFLEILGLHC